MARRACRHLVCESPEETFQVLTVPWDYDFSKGLPTTGVATFDTVDEAIEELSVRMEPTW